MATETVAVAVAARAKADTAAAQTYADLRLALRDHDIYMPELHVDRDYGVDRQHLMILGWVSMNGAQKLANALKAARS